jgi:hypothetical protein
VLFGTVPVEAEEKYIQDTISIQNENTVNVTGELSHANQGAISEGRIIVSNVSSFKTYTSDLDSDGNFKVTVPPDPETTVTYAQPDGSLDGIPDQYTIGQIEATADLNVGQITLPSANVLNIQVVDSTGTPVEDATVTVWHYNPDPSEGSYIKKSSFGNGVDKTNENGYAIRNLSASRDYEAAGEVLVQVSRPQGSYRPGEDVAVSRDITMDGNRDVMIQLSDQDNLDSDESAGDENDGNDGTDDGFADNDDGSDGGTNSPPCDEGERRIPVEGGTDRCKPYDDDGDDDSDDGPDEDSDWPPSVEFDISPANATVGSEIEFTADIPSNLADSITSYKWDFNGNGSIEKSGQTTEYTYESAGEYNVELTLTGPNGEAISNNKTVSVQSNEINPDIKAVTPEVNGTKIQGISFSNTYSAKIDSERQIDKVKFELNGRTKIDTNGSDGWQQDLDMGLLNKNSILRVTAVDKAGNKDIYTSTLSVTGVPPWIQKLAEQGTVDVNQDRGTVEIHQTVPNPPVNSKLQVPENVPVAGGEHTFEAESRFGVTYHMPDGRAVVLGEGELDVEIADRKATGELGSQGTISTDTWELQSGKVWAEVEVEAWSTSYGFDHEVYQPVEVAVSVNSDVRTDIYLDNRNSGLQVTRGSIEPGVSATGEVVTDMPVGTATGTMEGDLSGYIEIPEPYRPGGTASFNTSITYEVVGNELTVTPPAFNVQKGFGSQANRVQTISNGSIKRSSWEVQNKTSSVPQVENKNNGKPSVRTTTSRSRTVGVATTAKATSDTRITANRVADQSPAITYDRGANKYRLVWSHQDLTKDISAGRDIYSSTAGGGDATWETANSITDDQHIDIDPSIATAPNGETLVVWTRVTKKLTEDDIDNPNQDRIDRLYNNTETVYALYDGNEWTEPHQLSDNTHPDIEPEVVYSSGADAWEIIWESDTDGNIGTATDSTVHRVEVESADGNDPIAVTETSTIPNATHAVIAGRDDANTPAGIAYLKPQPGSRIDGTIEYAHITADESTQHHDVIRRTTTTRLKDIALNQDSLAWVDGPASDPTVHHTTNAQSTQATPLSIQNLISIRDVELSSTANGEYEFLTYRGKSSETGSKAVYYKLRKDDTWVRDRPLTSDKTDLTYWQAVTAVGNNQNEFVTAFAGKNISKSDQKNDIFAVRHSFRPDLAVDITSQIASEDLDVGDEVTLEIDVSNTGDIPTSQKVPVRVTGGAETGMAETQVDALDVGETRTVELTTQIDATGELSTTVDGDNTISEITKTNNEDSIRLIKPDLSVEAVTATRTGQEAIINMSILNQGAAAAESVDYHISQHRSTIENRTIETIKPGETSKVSIPVEASQITAEKIVTVEVDPNDEITESNKRNNGWSGRLLRPDIVLDAKKIDYYENRDSDGIVIDLPIENIGDSETTATLSVLQNQTQLANTTFTIDATTVKNSNGNKRVTVTVPEATSNDSLVLAARSPYDTNGRNNALTVTVPTSLSTPPDNLKRFEDRTFNEREYNAVFGDDGTQTQAELSSAINEWFTSESNSVNGVTLSQDDMSDLINYWFNNL